MRISKNNQLIFLSITILAFILWISFYLGKEQLDKIKDGLYIFSGLTSLVTMIIALLLFNKYGLDKTVKERNLNTSLKLLSEIKKVRIKIEGKSFSCYYGAAIDNIQQFEDFYDKKLLFPQSYYQDLNSINELYQDLFLPKEIKSKLKIIVPTMSFHVPKKVDTSEYGRVIINNNSDSNEWEFSGINDNSDITVFDYLTNWDELITAIDKWCNENSNTRLDLNMRYE